MGQYYRFVNVDKKEFYEPDGVKLMAFSYTYDGDMHALMALIAGPWKGCRVYVVGDYADHSEEPDAENAAWLAQMNAVAAELGFDKLFRDREGAFFNEGGEERYPVSLYSFARNKFKDITAKAKGRAIDGMAFRYIINGTLGVYIDLVNCPADAVDLDSDGTVCTRRVHPLSLLLAMGNGRGGGDFRGTYFNGTERVDVGESSVIGSWTATSASITFAKQGEEDKLQGLQEYRPDFSEEKNPLSPAEIQQRIAELKAKAGVAA